MAGKHGNFQEREDPHGSLQTDSKDGGNYEYSNVRSPEQTAAMERDEREGKCVFCEPESDREILREGKYWYITPNSFPYENTAEHLLIVPHTHHQSLEELPPEAGQELLEMAQWAIHVKEMGWGGLGARFGDMRYSGATVGHLHFNLLSAKREPEPGTKRVRMAMGPKVPPLEQKA